MAFSRLDRRAVGVPGSNHNQQPTPPAAVPRTNQQTVRSGYCDKKQMNDAPLSDVLINLSDWYDEEVNLLGPATRKRLGKDAIYAIAIANLRERRALEIGQKFIAFWDERINCKRPETKE